MENTLSQQGCLIFSQKDLALQCVGFERPWEAVCVHWTLSSTGKSMAKGVYVAAKNMSGPDRSQCVQQRLLGVLTLLWQGFYLN